MSLRAVRPAAVLLPVALLCGCGDGHLKTAPVRGTVTCGGVPLTTGSVSFTPVVEGAAGVNQARPAIGAVQPDGTFVLTTYESGDGALIGKHVVRYSPPPPPGEGEELGDEGGDSAVPPPPVAKGTKLPCRFGGQAEAEVKEGENDLKIELKELGPGGEEKGDSGRGR